MGKINFQKLWADLGLDLGKRDRRHKEQTKELGILKKVEDSIQTNKQSVEDKLKEFKRYNDTLSLHSKQSKESMALKPIPTDLERCVLTLAVLLFFFVFNGHLDILDRLA